MGKKKFSALTFEYPTQGYNLICFDGYMYLGDLSGSLPLNKENIRFGEHLLEAGHSRIVQIGDERGSAVWLMLRMAEECNLLYLGTLIDDSKKMLLFEIWESGKPKQFNRNLFGEIEDKPYLNLYVAFNYLSESELHITTCSHAGRIFRSTIVFA